MVVVDLDWHVAPAARVEDRGVWSVGRARLWPLHVDILHMDLLGAARLVTWLPAITLLLSVGLFGVALGVDVLLPVGDLIDLLLNDCLLLGRGFPWWLRFVLILGQLLCEVGHRQGFIILGLL